MNKILTHVDSLDSDIVSVPDLDVDAALASTIVRGTQIARRRRITQGLQGLGAVLVIALTITGAVRYAQDTSDGGNVAVKKIEKVPTNVTVATLPVDTTPTSTPAVDLDKSYPYGNDALPGISLPAVSRWHGNWTDEYVTIMEYGNDSSCDYASYTQDPDGTGVGTALSYETWVPEPGGTKIINAGESGHPVTIVDVTDPNDIKRPYVNLLSGFDTSTSTATVTNNVLSYCEIGFRFAITRAEEGYVILRESW